MLPEKVFDILMQARKMDRKVSEQHIELLKGKRDVLTLKENIMKVRDLQLKALTILNASQANFRETIVTLKDHSTQFHKLIDNLACAENETNENKESKKTIDELTKIKQDLTLKLIKANVEKRELSKKLNEIELQIKLQRNKNGHVPEEPQCDILDLLEICRENPSKLKETFI